MTNIGNILVIDDNEEQLNDIRNALFSGGISCLPIHYQYDLMENPSGVDHVEIDNFDTRIVISDLNLREGSLTNTMELVTPIAQVLTKIINEGPYILIFWSRSPEQIDEVMTLLKNRFNESVILPLHYACIDKNAYLGQENSDALKVKVKEIIKESEVFNVLLNWERRVYRAAQATTNSLFNLTKPIELAEGADYQAIHTEKLQTILATIGNETLGIKNAKVEPSVAIDSGLSPVLHDHLQVLPNNQEPAEWLSAIPMIGERFDYDEGIKAHLNSFYHIEQANGDSTKSKRGAWVELKSEYLDPEQKASKLTVHLGKPIKTIIHEEFLDSRVGTSAERGAARNNIKLGFVELSAECDQAQRKTKLHKYLLSALIPVEHHRFTMFGEGTREKAHSGIYRLPNLIINGQEYIVKVTFMYQIGAIPDIHKWLADPQFRLKDQILADISYQCSQHASRPGIIRFD